MSEEKTQVPNPKARYQLVSPEGHLLGIYDTALEAASAAEGFWPGVGQRDGDGPGWDIHVMGSER